MHKYVIRCKEENILPVSNCTLDLIRSEREKAALMHNECVAKIEYFRVLELLFLLSHLIIITIYILPKNSILPCLSSPTPGPRQ